VPFQRLAPDVVAGLQSAAGSCGRPRHAQNQAAPTRFSAARWGEAPASYHRPCQEEVLQHGWIPFSAVGAIAAAPMIQAGRRCVGRIQAGAGG